MIEDLLSIGGLLAIRDLLAIKHLLAICQDFQDFDDLVSTHPHDFPQDQHQEFGKSCQEIEIKILVIGITLGVGP